MRPQFTNWGGSHQFEAPRLQTPKSIEELQHVIASSSRARAVGTRHSFNDIADCDGTLVSLRRMSIGVEVDETTRTAWVPAGMSYGALAGELETYGLALANTGSLPHISIGGACAVGTHGSGDGNRVLSASVSGMRIVVAGGELRTILAGDADFTGAVVSLGALGVVVQLRLDLVPTYDLRQDVYLGLPFERLTDQEGLDDIFSSGYSVSAFLTSWSAAAVDQLWIKTLAAGIDDPPRERWSAPRATQQTTPLGDPADTTPQGVVGPWADRLPHTRRDRPLATGNEIQSEYFVARTHAAEALDALRGQARAIDPALAVSELRSVAADRLWLSPAHDRDSIAIHFTWHPEPELVRSAMRAIERSLEPFHARPHWGKWFDMDAERVAAVTPRVTDFRLLCDRWDPDRVFRNRFLERVMGLGIVPQTRI